MVMLLGKVRAKYFFEKIYWRLMWILENRKLTNDQYKAAFTQVFGLSVEFFANKRILDIGCGPRGSLEWTPESSICFGLDPLAEEYLKLNGNRHRMTYISGNAESMPFVDEEFDIVSSFNSLDHVDDLEKVLPEITRVIKTGGDFLLIVDIHEKPALCEPIAIGWDFTQKLAEQFDLVFEKHFKRSSQVYRSLKDAIPYEGGDYGLLVARFTKNST